MQYETDGRNATKYSIRNGIRSKTCVDLIFTSVPQQCPSANVFPVSWSGQNVVSITKITKISKGPPRMIPKRSFKNFNCEEFKRDLAASSWELIYLEDNLNHVSECFTKLLTSAMNRHDAVRKRTVKARSVP